MAKGKTMLQAEGIFGVAQNVQSEVPSSLFAYAWLDGASRNRVRVREVSAQQSYFTGFSGPSGSGVGSIATGGAAFATLTLIVNGSRSFNAVKALIKDEITFGTKYYFHAPSFRDSPDVDGVDLAFLKVTMPHWSVVSPWKIQSAKRMAGHAYFDEESVPLPPVKMKPPPKSVLDDKAKIGKIAKTSEAKKSDSSSQDMMVEFGIGDLSLGLTDQRGITLSEMRFSVSGDPEARGGLILPLSLSTNEGEVRVTPTLISRSSAEQPVLFDNIEPREFVRARAREIGCSKNITSQLQRGKVKQRLSPSIYFNSFA